MCTALFQVTQSSRLLLMLSLSLLGSLGAERLSAQGYPKLSKQQAAEANARQQAADARSDAIFAAIKPELDRWASLGKPYIPSAAMPDQLPQASIPAFPRAEGGGKFSFGGRGGKVLVVTNLHDDGPGSFREACEAAGPRIVVFNVAGIIKLKDRIRIRAPYITIAGSTAPGDGVCIAGNTVELETHDVIIRHMRFRRGATDAADRNDSIGGNPIGNIMIDHVSASWGLDENMSMYRHMYRAPDSEVDQKLPTVNITIQNSIFSEALNTYHHAFGSTIGGFNSTFMGNLWANNTGRNPSVGMNGDFTFANNVIYNYRHRTVDGGDHLSRFNIINNYFKPGPGTPKSSIAYRVLKPESERSRTVVDNFGKAYVAGNFVEGYPEVSADNWKGGVQPSSKAAVESVLPSIRVDEPFSYAKFPIVDAKVAFEQVLKSAGATLPIRDAVDRRVVEMVRSGTVGAATILPSSLELAAKVGYKQEYLDELTVGVTHGYITDPAEVGGYPEYRGQPYIDKDSDGLPDSWEQKHGLDPANPQDSVQDSDRDGYVNIEEFINGTDPSA